MFSDYPSVRNVYPSSEYIQVLYSFKEGIVLEMGGNIMDLPFGKLEPNSNQIFLDYGSYVLVVCKDDALFSITAPLCH